MNTTNSLMQPPAGDLFSRVVAILEKARSSVVRSINVRMVMAYWLIGREIVQELQDGEERAVYGRQVIEVLSAKLTERFGRGFSAPTLWSFRQFYQVYSDRFKILSPTGRESQTIELPHGFSPQLSWSHYRALMRVQDEKALVFYEKVKG